MTRRASPTPNLPERPVSPGPSVPAALCLVDPSPELMELITQLLSATPPDPRCRQAAAHCVGHAGPARRIVAVNDSCRLKSPVLPARAAGRTAKLNVVPLEELMRMNEELGQMFGWCAPWSCA